MNRLFGVVRLAFRAAKRVVLLPVAGSVLVGADSPAKLCSDLRPLPGELGYKQRGSRCEGLYVADIGGSSVDIVSFTVGPVAFELAPGTQLKVQVQSSWDEVNVRAIAIPPRTYYRMDAKVAKGAQLLWPVGDVLLRQKLTASRIGVFGWIGPVDKVTFIPVRIEAHNAPATLSNLAPLLYVRTSFDAEKIKWRWGTLQNDECSRSNPWRNATDRLVTNGWPVAIGLGEVPTGPACVEIAAQSQETGWVTKRIRVELSK